MGTSNFRGGLMMLIAGVDEAGRGPLAGPVIAAAVILDARRSIAGLADSKLLSAARRERLAAHIQAQARAWSIGRADPEEIDRLNILNASLLAMQRAIAGLTVAPAQVLVDGNRCPVTRYPVRAIVQGDKTEPCISAASILAKVCRDRELLALEQRYPGYGFARHKGYPTRQHLQALAELGPCPSHRRSFAPVRKLLSVAAGAQSEGNDAQVAVHAGSSAAVACKPWT
ncbi:MAG: ribonuclease HII [Gammaproteobacteria bacterium]|nr:ribonuclease HII [Gammaproteobacteria bacterium]